MFKIVENGLTPQIYRDLRNTVNFKEYPDEDVAIALKNSLYCLVVYDGDIPIGMARIVGDNKVSFFLKDVIVEKSYQKRKVGSLLMDKIFEYLDNNASDGAYVGLMSTPDCVAFYEKHGFIQRPNDGMGPGMILFYTRGGDMDDEKNSCTR